MLSRMLVSLLDHAAVVIDEENSSALIESIVNRIIKKNSRRKTRSKNREEHPCRVCYSPMPMPISLAVCDAGNSAGAERSENP